MSYSCVGLGASGGNYSWYGITSPNGAFIWNMLSDDAMWSTFSPAFAVYGLQVRKHPSRPAYCGGSGSYYKHKDGVKYPRRECFT